MRDHPAICTFCAENSPWGRKDNCRKRKAINSFSSTQYQITFARWNISKNSNPTKSRCAVLPGYIYSPQKENSNLHTPKQILVCLQENLEGWEFNLSMSLFQDVLWDDHLSKEVVICIWSNGFSHSTLEIALFWPNVGHQKHQIGSIFIFSHRHFHTGRVNNRSFGHMTKHQQQKPGVLHPSPYQTLAICVSFQVPSFLRDRHPMPAQTFGPLSGPS